MITKLTASGPQALPFTWEYTLQSGYGALTAAPLVAGDRLICTAAGYIFALDLYTGQEIKSTGGFPYKLKPAMKPPLTTHSRGSVYISNAGEVRLRRGIAGGNEGAESQRAFATDVESFGSFPLLVHLNRSAVNVHLDDSCTTHDCHVMPRSVAAVCQRMEKR